MEGGACQTGILVELDVSFSTARRSRFDESGCRMDHGMVRTSWNCTVAVTQVSIRHDRIRISMSA